MIWLGFNDVEKEGNFVDDKGLKMSWDNWNKPSWKPEPNGGDSEGWFIFVSRIIYQIYFNIYVIK